ncbi:GGDEF domain-containing protein [Treponema sp. C6A8]|uniref:GGDEF domain-containing protein n=1 Tax=Treponema sp. C6A8 TaxID=1410609 RepID=UPI0009DD04C0|nr:GGDEF domain-containing protein [Treponema sp. C6A8]
MVKNEQFLIDFISNCKNTCYITSDSSTMGQIPKILGQDYCVINLLNDYSPLKPFLELLRFYNPPFRTLESCVYPPQLETFATYIHNGTATERQDLILEDEFSYEKSLIKNAIIKLIEDQNDGTNYIFLNAQQMNEDSLEIVRELESKEINGKFIFCFDSSDPLTARKTVMNFLKKVERGSHALCDFKLEKQYGKDLEDAVPELSPEDLINALRNARLFLDVKTVLGLAAEGLEQLAKATSVKQERELALEISLAYYLSSDLDKAAVLLADISDAGIDDIFDLKAKLYLSKIYLSKSMIPLSKKYSASVLQKLIEAKNKKSHLYALACMLDYFSSTREDNSMLCDKYMEAMDILLRCDLNNNYLNTALHFPVQIFEDKKNEKIFANILEKTERIADEIQNRHLVAAVYHWKAIHDEFNGDINSARKDFDKAEKIRTELGDLEQLLRIKNGISDFNLRICHIKEAYNVLNDFTENLFLINDYPLIIESLKNQGQAAFYFHDYETAEQITLTLLDLYKKFITTEVAINSYVPKQNDFFCFQAVTDIYNQDFFHAEMNYSILLNGMNEISDNCKPFVPFIQACLLAQKGDFTKSQKALDTAISQLKKLEKYNHIIVFILYEYAILLDRLEQKELSEKAFNQGLEVAKEHSLVHFYKNKKEYTLADYVKSFSKLAPLNINHRMLEDKAAKDYTINSLHNKINEYQFINKVNSFSGIISGSKAYLEKISYLICEFLTAQSVTFAQLGLSKKWSNVTSFAQSSTKEKMLPENIWENLFQKYGNQERLELIFDSDYEFYYCNLSKFDYHGALIIIPYAKKISSSVLQIINIALANIQSQLVIFQQNENMAAINATDPITALPNRRGLLRHLTLESERIERFHKRKGQVIQKAIAIIDIDNFKYYNERFGHIVGDFLLRSFADILKKTLRRIDFVCRYGGDEFVVVMSDTTPLEAERMCQRLYIELSKEDFFLTELKKFTRQDIDIPENKKIGFSMGLCSNSDIPAPENLTEVMRNADKALKYTREKSKGSVSNWLKIKDLL